MEPTKNSDFQFALFEMYFRQPDLSTHQSNQTTHSNKNPFKQIPNNCFDIYDNFKDYRPGVYTIKLDNHTFTDVNCLKGGWTVIQSSGQYSDPLSFDKNWAEYKAGFGTPGK